jgi:hypothetical protein
LVDAAQDPFAFRPLVLRFLANMSGLGHTASSETWPSG